MISAMRLFALALTIAAAVAVPSSGSAQTTIEPRGDTTDAAIEGRPALWRLSDADSTVWIFGSIHLLYPDMEWRFAALDQAFAEVDIVYFESRLGESLESALQARVYAIAFNAPGVTLSDQLSPDGRARLARVATRLGVSPTMLDTLKPWMAFWSLTTLVYQAEGAVTESGVDPTLHAEAVAAGKEIRAFEDIEDVMRYLTDYSEADQIAILELSLRQIEEKPETPRALIEAWSAGDMERIGALVLDDIDDAPAAFYERLFRERNVAWAEQIDAFMAGSGDALIVVGAGHMVGPDSLILLLEARGHAVERR